MLTGWHKYLQGWDTIRPQQLPVPPIFLSTVSGWHGQQQQQSSFLNRLGLSNVRNAQLLLQQRLSHMKPHTIFK